MALDDDPLDIEAIVRASEKGDRLCYQALNRAGEMVGVGIGTLIKVLSIQRVAMYGILPRMSSVFMEAVRRSAKLSVLPLIEPDIRISSLPTHAVPQGAALFALDRVFASRTEELIHTAQKE
jgi:predicted NBD/HSP70 family sugar kinase